MDEKRAGKIESLRRSLYSRSKQQVDAHRSRISPDAEEVPDTFQENSSTPAPVSQVSVMKKKRNPLHLFFILSVFFFIGALALAGLFIFGGGNVVSTENVRIEIEGPISVAGGDELTLQVAVTNENTVSMELVDLLIEFPEGTRAAGDLNTELTRMRQSLGTIEPGERVKRTIKAVLFGEENEEQNIVVAAEYRVSGSNAIFFTEEDYKVKLSSSPLGIFIEGFTEAVSGQEVSLTITIASNATAVLEDVLLRAEYPFGFRLKTSNPEPSFSSNIFAIGDLAPGEMREIRLQGVLEGQDGELRVFRFASGSADENNERELAVAFITASHEFTLKRPFLSASVALNGDASDISHVARSGETIRGDVTITNNLSETIFDAVVEVHIVGTGLNESSVNPSGGFYRSVDNTIIWNRNTDSRLASLAPGESQNLSFTFSPHSQGQLTTEVEPRIALALTAKGSRVDNDVPEEIVSTAKREVLVTSDVGLIAKGLHFVGPFSNTGPMPPMVNEETTYTIVWTVTNTTNDMDDVVVSGALPSYMRFLGNTSPQTEDISFNQVGGRVTWRVGNVSSGVGTTKSPREVSFQVGLTPSTSQINEQVVLIIDQSVRGRDAFTKRTVETTRAPVTTRLLQDPQFVDGQEQVQQ